jgi:N-methylhydantoinase B/oxoprolinase/acetone carboxylase alpha subunit
MSIQPVQQAMSERRLLAQTEFSLSPLCSGGAASRIDFATTPDYLPNRMNVTEANASSAVTIGVSSSLGETVPRNAGSYCRITIYLRESCCVGGPRRPAS